MKPGRLLGSANAMTPAAARWLWTAAAVGLAAAALASGGRAAAADAAPDWLDSARRLPVPAQASRADRVVLLEESLTEVSRSETRERVREVVRINKESGLKHLLAAPQRYGEEFKLVGAWKVRPDGEAQAYDRKTITQYDADGSYQFSMQKVNTFRPPELHVGDVMAWEYQTRSKPESYVVGWGFGGTFPTVLSRFGLKSPPDWTQRRHLAHVAELPAARNDEGYTVWEMRDLEGLPDEPSMPAAGDLLPQLFIVYGPPGGQADERRRDTWKDLARWYSGIATPQIASDGTLRRTALDLAGAAAGSLQGVRAITGFTQSLRYLDTAIGRSTAEPHPAPLILRNRFGDCEDKAILTIAMLREVGVEAFPVLARTRSAGTVQQDFPGVDMFNHAIVAIRMPEGTASMAAGVDAGALGRLLIFDPTDSYTGLGDLPWSLQGTLALIVHPDKGQLVALPTLDPALSSRAADVELGVDAAGQMQVRARVVHEGQYAARERLHYGVVRAEKRREELATRLGRHHGKVEVKRLDVKGLDESGDPVELQLDLSMKWPGRDAGSMHIMPLSFLLPTMAETLSGATRRTPLVLEGAYREAEISRCPLPPGYSLASDLPSLDFSGSAGSYRLTARIEDGVLITERELIVRSVTVEPAAYPEVKKFFDEVARGDASTVVLRKEI